MEVSTCRSEDRAAGPRTIGAMVYGADFHPSPMWSPIRALFVPDPGSMRPPCGLHAGLIRALSGLHAAPMGASFECNRVILVACGREAERPW